MTRTLDPAPREAVDLPRLTPRYGSYRGSIPAVDLRPLTPLASSGSASVRGRRFSLDGGLGGFDVTQGLLARRTVWRWAFALGRAEDGSAFGMNLVRGFAGEAECAVWTGDALLPVGEGVIAFDDARPKEPWRVTSACGAVDLTFTPKDFHREERRLVLVSSRFVQGVGTFGGTVSPPGRPPLRLTNVLGVTEDQNTLW